MGDDVRTGIAAALLLTVCALPVLAQPIDATKLKNRDNVWYQTETGKPFTGEALSRYGNGSSVVSRYVDGIVHWSRSTAKDGRLEYELTYVPAVKDWDGIWYTSSGATLAEKRYDKKSGQFTEKYYYRNNNRLKRLRVSTDRGIVMRRASYLNDGTLVLDVQSDADGRIQKKSIVGNAKVAADIAAYARNPSKGIGSYWLAYEAAAGIGDQQAVARLQAIAADVSAKVTIKSSYQEADITRILEAIGDTLSAHGYQYDQGIAAGTMFHKTIFSERLMSRRIKCDETAILYVTLGEMLGLPLYAMLLNEHMAVLWDDGKTRVLWETTSNFQATLATYDKYIKPYEDEFAVVTGTYLGPLKRQELFGYMLGLVAEAANQSDSDEYSASLRIEATRVMPVLFLKGSDELFDAADYEKRMVRAFGDRSLSANYAMAIAIEDPQKRVTFYSRSLLHPVDWIAKRSRSSLDALYQILADSVPQRVVAAERGDVEAQVALAELYLYGTSKLPRDLAQAMRWAEAVSKAGNPRGWELQARVHLNENTSYFDQERARVLFQKAAEANLPSAQYNLALMYIRGIGMPADPAQGLAWMRRAADNDHAEATRNIGVFYSKGLGVSQDMEEAARWYRKSMRLGSSRAFKDLQSMGADPRG